MGKIWENFALGVVTGVSIFICVMFIFLFIHYGVPAMVYGIGWVQFQGFSGKYSAIGENVPFSFDESQAKCSNLIFKLHDVGSVWLDNYKGVYDKDEWRIVEVRGDWTCLQRLK